MFMQFTILFRFANSHYFCSKLCLYNHDTLMLQLYFNGPTNNTLQHITVMKLERCCNNTATRQHCKNRTYTQQSATKLWHYSSNAAAATLQHCSSNMATLQQQQQCNKNNTATSQQHCSTRAATVQHYDSNTATQKQRRAPPQQQSHFTTAW